MAKSSVHTGNEPALRTFGLAVRELRLSRNLSQEDLAGLDRFYTGGIERGEHNVALINIQRIAQALDIKIATLMDHANL